MAGIWITNLFENIIKAMDSLLPEEKLHILRRVPGYTDVLSSISHNSQKIETSQMFIDRSMDKQNVARTGKGIKVYSFKRNKILTHTTT